MDVPGDAVLPPKTAASSFPGAGWKYWKRDEEETKRAGRAKENDGERAGSPAEGLWCQEAVIGGEEMMNTHADEESSCSSPARKGRSRASRLAAVDGKIEKCAPGCRNSSRQAGHL